MTSRAHRATAAVAACARGCGAARRAAPAARQVHVPQGAGEVRVQAARAALQ